MVQPQLLVQISNWCENGYILDLPVTSFLGLWAIFLIIFNRLTKEGDNDGI